MTHHLLVLCSLTLLLCCSCGETADEGPDPIDQASTDPDESGDPDFSDAPTNAVAGYHNESEFVETLKTDYKHLLVDGTNRVLNYNREGSTSIKYSEPFNIESKHKPTGFKWEVTDRNDGDWYPQGVAGTGKTKIASLTGGTEKRLILASWYNRGKEFNDMDFRGVRISVVDLKKDSAKYRHILLVQKKANIEDNVLFNDEGFTGDYKQAEVFAPIPIHAGGIEVDGDLLYVADTKHGIRVFDLKNIFEADDSDKYKDSPTIGAIDNKLVAFGYRYVLPQIGYYIMEEGPSFSFISMDSVTEGEKTTKYLISGQWKKSGTPKNHAFVIEDGCDSTDPNGCIETTPTVFPTADSPDDDGDARVVLNAQGVARVNGVWWTSITNQKTFENSKARLVMTTMSEDGTKAKTGKRFRWPHGAEDLYYETDTGLLWCLTEFPDWENLTYMTDRIVFAVDLSTYN